VDDDTPQNEGDEREQEDASEHAFAY